MWNGYESDGDGCYLSWIPLLFKKFLQTIGNMKHFLKWSNKNQYEPSKSEVRYSRYHDLLLAIGWLSALQACRRLIPSAFVWLGVPCSQWVWISRGSTGRCRLRPHGSKKWSSVRRMNKLVRRLCYLFLGSPVFIFPYPLIHCFWYRFGLWVEWWDI